MVATFSTPSFSLAVHENVSTRFANFLAHAHSNTLNEHGPLIVRGNTASQCVTLRVRMTPPPI